MQAYRLCYDKSKKNSSLIPSNDKNSQIKILLSGKKLKISKTNPMSLQARKED